MSDSSRKSSSVLVIAVFIISAPIKISKPNVRNVKRGDVPENGVLGDSIFELTYLDTSKTDPKSIRKPPMRFMNSTTNVSIEKNRCSISRSKS